MLEDADRIDDVQPSVRRERFDAHLSRCETRTEPAVIEEAPLVPVGLDRRYADNRVRVDCRDVCATGAEEDRQGIEPGADLQNSRPLCDRLELRRHPWILDRSRC